MRRSSRKACCFDQTPSIRCCVGEWNRGQWMVACEKISASCVQVVGDSCDVVLCRAPRFFVLDGMAILPFR